MPIRYRCHACGQLLSIASRMGGRTFPCPTCQATTIVPAAGEPSPPDGAVLPPMPEEWNQFSPQPGDTTVRPDPPLHASPSTPVSTVETPGTPYSVEITERPERTLELDPYSDDAAEAVAQRDDRGDKEVPDVDDAPSVVVLVAGADELPSRPMSVEGGGKSRFSTFAVPTLLFACFMITALFSFRNSGQIPLPSSEEKVALSNAGAPQKMGTHSIFVHVDDKDVVFVDDKEVPDDSQLAARLLKAMGAVARVEIELDVDVAASKAKIASVVNTAHGVGIQQIRMGVSQRSSPAR